MKKILLLLSLFMALIVQAQPGDRIYQPYIRSVKLYRAGDFYSYPVLNLNSPDLLELHFDDMEANSKSCYYTYQLCDADWSPSDMRPFDYIKGFQSNRITTYRYSSLSETKYMHYTATIPDRNCMPIRSGNYLLKVFLNNDTSQLLFTKRFMIIDSRVSIGAQVLKPFNAQITITDQRIRVAVSTANAQINTLSPQDLKIVVLQNNIWPTSIMVNRANIYRGDYFEYNDDATAFPAGKEWRWIDLRTMRLKTDRMLGIVDTAKRIEVYVKPDAERRQQVYIYYRDINGRFTVENQDGNNPDWQSDYAYVHFTYVPPGKQAYPGRDLYIFGELSNYSADDAYKMTFNPDKGVYEGTLFLKQGYYDYDYVLVDPRTRVIERTSFAETEGNYDITENGYTILVYYKPFGGRYDQLIGYTLINSLTATR